MKQITMDFETYQRELRRSEEEVNKKSYEKGIKWTLDLLDLYFFPKSSDVVYEEERALTIAESFKEVPELRSLLQKLESLLPNTKEVTTWK